MRWFFFGLLCACGGATESVPNQPTDDPIAEPSEALRASLVRRLEATVLDTYGHLNLNNADAFMSALVRDRPVTLIGPTDREYYDSAPRPRMMVPRLVVARSADIVSKNLEVYVATSGEIGWVFDEVSYRALHQERIASIPIRRTAVYLFQNGEWLLAQEHRSYPTEIASLRAFVEAGRVPRLPPIPQPPAAAKLPPDVLAVVHQFQQPGEGEARRAIAATPSALLLLPGWDGEYEGARIREAPNLEQILGGTGAVNERGCRLTILPSGNAAYGHCLLGLREAGGKELGLRASYVLERKKGGPFRIVQAHVSAPIFTEQLEALAFGD